jgi:peptidoglycan-associated lipoprotein
MYRRSVAAFALTCLLGACGSDSTSGSATGGGSAGAGGYGSTGVQSSALGAAGGAAGHTLAQGVPDRVLFATDAASLAPEARTTLDTQTIWLKQNPQVAVQIAGNCDERGTEEYNLALGQRRANTARDYLVSHGIDGNRVQTISYGKDRPTALGSDPDSWAQNRNAITSVQGARAPGA